MATLTASPASTDYLIPGEMPHTTDPEDARQWVTIYRELVAFASRTLSRLRAEASSGKRQASGASEVDQAWMGSHLERLESRLQYWERHLWELAGLDLDVGSRVLIHGGQRLNLTRRETELLAFLAEHPSQFFTASELLDEAWRSSDLSEEQLRTYVVRLRRHLASAGVPARLVSEPRRGYGLIFNS